jgi:hypothetical protein
LKDIKERGIVMAKNAKKKVDAKTHPKHDYQKEDKKDKK